MRPTQGPYILQLCMGPPYFWRVWPPLTLPYFAHCFYTCFNIRCFYNSCDTPVASASWYLDSASASLFRGLVNIPASTKLFRHEVQRKVSQCLSTAWNLPMSHPGRSRSHVLRGHVEMLTITAAAGGSVSIASSTATDLKATLTLIRLRVYTYTGINLRTRKISKILCPRLNYTLTA